jgi:acetylornithine/N-succinyldiaminopimelate aminotransferase
MPAGFASVPLDDAEAMRSAVGPSTAAVMIEPILGEAGIYPVPDQTLVAARETCDEAGALLLFDEIQTGVGRTGSLWAYEQSPVRPDVITTAKALGGGMPIGACVTTPELSDTLEAGDHGSTFAGGPVPASAALATLEVVDDADLLRRVHDVGTELAGSMMALDAVREVRGRGLMLGVGLEEGIDANRIAESLLASGLVVNVPEPKTLRLLPPLTIGSEEVRHAVAIVGEALAEAGDAG